MTVKVSDVVLVQRKRSLSENHLAPLSVGPGEPAIISYVFPSGNVSGTGFSAAGGTFHIHDCPVVDSPTTETQMPYVGPVAILVKQKSDGPVITKDSVDHVVDPSKAAS